MRKRIRLSFQTSVYLIIFNYNHHVNEIFNKLPQTIFVIRGMKNINGQGGANTVFFISFESDIWGPIIKSCLSGTRNITETKSNGQNIVQCFLFLISASLRLGILLFLTIKFYYQLPEDTKAENYKCKRENEKLLMKSTI